MITVDYIRSGDLTFVELSGSKLATRSRKGYWRMSSLRFSAQVLNDQLPGDFVRWYPKE